MKYLSTIMGLAVGVGMWVCSFFDCRRQGGKAAALVTESLPRLFCVLLGGAIGGAGGGKAVKPAALGPIGNILAGALGGAGGAIVTGGGGILGSLLGTAANSGVDFGALAGQLVGGGLTGLIVQVVVGMIVNKLKG